MSKTNNITAIVLTRNEEKSLPQTLKSLRFCEEVIVIDDYSTDKTPQIARKYNAQLFKRHLHDDFSKQRNYGLSKASCDWVLFIDADEVVSPPLALEIVDAVEATDVSGYFLNRSDNFLNKRMRGGEFGNIRLLRLAKRKAGTWRRSIHEYWDVSGNRKTLYHVLDHNSHENLSQFITQISFHASLHGKNKPKNTIKNNIFVLMAFPFVKFLKSFFLQGGWKDGTYGFVALMGMSFHSFLSWSSLWLSTRLKNYQE